MRFVWMMGVMGMLGVCCMGCQNQMMDERDAAIRQSDELQARLKAKDTELTQLQAQDAQKDQELARLRNAPQNPVAPTTPAGLNGLDTQYDAAAGTMTVNLQGDVLFASGQAMLKESAKATLDKVAGVLTSDYNGKPVRIEGHTDADKIIRTKDQWEDNLDLSQSRAANVTRYLISKGVEPKRITTSGFGEYRPKGGGKAADRRVEIVVVTREAREQHTTAMPKSLCILDYGMANLKSVRNGFAQSGFDAEIITSAQEIDRADRLVLPGVGAFQDAVDTLREKGLDGAIRKHIGSGRPFLGICLGLQMLFDVGYEDGTHEGLGILRGDCVRFDVDTAPDPAHRLKVPHMGWNQLAIARPAPILNGLGETPNVYFVHGYHVRPADPSIIASTTDYGGPFVSSIWRDNIFATQFHPEKSQAVGLKILENFARL